MQKATILALDGGATKTTLTIRSTDGERLYEKTASGSNFQTIGASAVIDVLSHLLLDAYQTVRNDSIDIAAFAIAGIDTKTDLETVTHIVHKSLQKTAFHINKLIIENDVQATLLGLVGNNPGALLISGTGSVAFATDGNGKFVRAGGWGHRASDEGSGYWIGRKILKAIFKSEDGLQEPTILKNLVFNKLEIDSIDQLMTWLYQTDYTNAQTANISSVLPEAVLHDDNIAVSIAKMAAHELYSLVKATLTKVAVEEKELTLYLNGGILKHHPFIVSSLEQYLLKDSPLITISLCGESPIENVVKRAIYSLKR